MSIKLKNTVNNSIVPSPRPANPVLNSPSNLDQALVMLKKTPKISTPVADAVFKCRKESRLNSECFSSGDLI